MPNRILKESICTSDNVDALNTFQETFFYRLIVNCDDFGRMDARPKILSSKLYPLKEIKVNQIEDALRALSAAKLLILYTVDDKPYLQMRTWDKHQQIRAKKSKYPAPDSGTITDDIIYNQLISDDIKCPRNPIQSKSNPNTNPNTNVQSAAFETFWKSYPRKQAMYKAQAEFAKLNPDETMLSTILNAVEVQKHSAQWERDGGQYIPLASTWLHQRRWEDEVITGGKKETKTVHAAQYEQRSYTEDDFANILDDPILRALESEGA